MPNLDVLRAMDPYVVAWVEPFRNYGAPRTKSFRNKVASLVQLKYRRARGAWKGGSEEEPPRNYDRTNTLVNRGGNPVWKEEDGDKAHLKVWVEDTMNEVRVAATGCSPVVRRRSRSACVLTIVGAMRRCCTWKRGTKTRSPPTSASACMR